MEEIIIERVNKHCFMDVNLVIVATHSCYIYNTVRVIEVIGLQIRILTVEEE